jgi:D-sedoheptulose 7-phosphate isomerase
MNRILNKVVEKHPQLADCLPDVEAAFEILRDCYRQGGKILVCGNGGSASDSEHIVGELMKGYLLERPVPEAFRRQLAEMFPEDGSYLADHLQGALPAISLVSQISLLTAISNDVAADMVFAQQVYGYGLPGDILLGISTSGRSKNVIYAVQVARARGMRAVALTGGSGWAMQALCDVTIRVSADATAEIQEQHMTIYHALCAMLEEAFFPR